MASSSLKCNEEESVQKSHQASSSSLGKASGCNPIDFRAGHLFVAALRERISQTVTLPMAPPQARRYPAWLQNEAVKTAPI
jgi:hypothetical protein